MTGHPGNRVDFQDLRLAVTSGHEIDPAPAAAPEDVECRSCKVVILLLQFRIVRPRAKVTRILGFVLGPVIVKDTRRFYSYTRQGLALQDSDRGLIADDAAFSQRRTAEAQCQIDSRLTLICRKHLGHPNTGALACRLDDQRKSEFVGSQFGVAGRFDHHIVGRGDAGGIEQMFAENLVHCDRRRENAAACVRRVEPLQHSL